MYEAAKETKKKFNPDLIVILSCCSGIIGDDVETVENNEENCKHCGSTYWAYRH